jgi:hypothetical protein
LLPAAPAFVRDPEEEALVVTAKASAVKSGPFGAAVSEALNEADTRACEQTGPGKTY